MKHCVIYLKGLISWSCEMIIYCHTFVYPGYCLFCLGKKCLSANQWMESWSRDHKLWIYVNEHLQGCCWPLICLHPSCNTSLQDEVSFQSHLIDNHWFSHMRPGHDLPNVLKESGPKKSSLGSANTLRGFTWKRKLTNNKYILIWAPPYPRHVCFNNCKRLCSRESFLSSTAIWRNSAQKRKHINDDDC